MRPEAHQPTTTSPGSLAPGDRTGLDAPRVATGGRGVGATVAPSLTGDEAPDETAWISPPRQDLTHGPLDRALLRLAGPAIAAKALYAALALMDVLWVGRLGAAPTAAVNTGFFTSWIL
jgi:hypothetical protein